MPVGNPATAQYLILLTKKKGRIIEQQLESLPGLTDTANKAELVNVLNGVIQVIDNVLLP